MGGGRRCAVVVTVVAVLATLVTATAATGASPAPPASAPRAVVGPGVAEAVAGAARSATAATPIVISLRDATPRDATVGRLRAGARAVQSAVLASAGPEGIEVLHAFETLPGLVVHLTEPAALERLAADPRVARIDLDVGGTGDLAGAVAAVGGNLSHARGLTGEGVTVAVLDTGADSDHPDLADDLVHQECFGGLGPEVGYCPNGTVRQSGPGAAEDDAGHGTHVAGIVTSAGAVAPVGMAPDAQVVAIKVMNNCSFSGCFDSFAATVVAALDWLILNEATYDVSLVNASLGTTARFAGDCDDAASYTQVAAAAVSVLRAFGVTVVASAGNEVDQAMGAPACLSEVISVGATNDAGVAAIFTNASPTTDVFAPGVDVVSAAIGGGTTSRSGTSMASPLTAGCAALLIEAGEGATPAALEARLETSARSVTAFGRSYPLVDCDIDPDPCVSTFVDVPPSHPFCRDIIWLAEENVTGGFPGNTYRPGVAVSRGSMAAFLYRMAGSPPVTVGAPSFHDVPASHPFFTEIEWLASTGITSGYPGDVFRPGTPVGRGSMAAFLYRAAGSPAVSAGSPSFVDVPASHPFFEEVEWLASTGITGGFPGDVFRPGAAVSRGSMAAFLHRYDDAGFEV